MRCIRCEKTLPPWWKYWAKHSCEEPVLFMSKLPKRHRNMRITELEEIRDISSNDVLLIVDIDKQESKKISMDQLKEFIKS